MAKKVKYDDDYANYTARELKKHKEDCYNHYKSTNGLASVKVLSRVGKVPQKVVREWLTREKWADLVNPQITPKAQKAMNSLADKHGLTEQEELFCLNYLKSYNATNAAMQAGYSPQSCYQSAYKLLGTERIKAYLADIRELRNSELMVDAMDIMREYMRIAFADMSDFCKFGPNGVRLNNSAHVDGRLVTEVREGRDGVTLKLADKMKALEKLSKYLDVFVEDRVKRELLQEQLNQVRNGTGGDKNGQLLELIRGLKDE